MWTLEDDQNMVTTKTKYTPKTVYEFSDEKRKQLAIVIEKITKFGLDPNEIGFFSQERYREKWENKQANIQVVT